MSDYLWKKCPLCCVDGAIFYRKGEEPPRNCTACSAISTKSNPNKVICPNCCPECEFDYEGELKGVLIERLAAELGQTCAQVQEWAYAETNRIMNEEMHNV